MKFGRQLQLGLYPPWKDHYISYDKLKRIIGRLKFLQEKDKDKQEKKKKEILDIESKSPITEMTPLRPKSTGEAPAPKELSFVGTDGLDFFAILEEELHKIDKFYVSKLVELRVRVEEVVDQWKTTHQSHHSNLTLSYLSELKDVYLQLNNLISFSELNKTGVKKIVKKYDKILEGKASKEWAERVEGFEFASTTEILGLIDVISEFVSRDKLLEWQHGEMMEKLQEQDNIMPAVKLLPLAVSLILFIVSFQLPPVAPNNPAANRCLSVLILSISLWLTTAIPYFATALVIPVLITVTGVLKDEVNHETVLSSSDSAKFVLGHLFNHTTMLLLGGYTLSSAFSRCQLELRAAAWMQKRFGHSPLKFLLAVMYLGLFLSMWISNHTAPILLSTMLLPLVRDLPKESNYTKSLLLGVAISCNFGGMMTPISSLQNALAVSNLEKVGVFITFTQWILVSIPFGTICVFLSWLALCFIMQPYDVKAIPIVVYDRENRMNKKNITVLVLASLTMIAFSTFEYTLKWLFGDIAMVAMVYIAIMFGSGLLTELDFNSLSWHTLFLLGGGSTLGKAVESSGLLETIAGNVTSQIPTDDPWFALVCFFFFALVVATFVSHTVASMILMPLVTQIGVNLQTPRMMVFGSALAVSAAMALPFSSFPNVNSMLIVDDFQSPYLTTKDFIITGLPLSVATVVLIATLGYQLVGLVMG